MTRIFLTNSTRVAERLRELGLEVGSYDAPPDLRDRLIAVVAAPGAAKPMALELISRGIADIRLDYVEVDDSQPLPERLKLKHLYWDDVVPLAEIEDAEDFPTYSTGLPCLSGNGGPVDWRWRIPELVILAGPYGSGKSTFGQMMASGFAAGEAGRQLRSGALLCSWEDLSSEVKRNVRLFGEAARQDDLLKRVHFVRRSADEDRLISWWVNLVRYHRERYGTRFFFLDPWNEMDHLKDSRVTETEYVKEMMKHFRRVVDQLQIIMVLATHVPAKNIRGDGSIEPFRIGHSFGSSQFANKADRGICIVRTKSIQAVDCEWGSIVADHGLTIIRHDKSKIERKMGKKGTLALAFNPDSFEYRLDALATARVKDVWKD